MYSVKEAATILNLSVRSIQLKCKKHKITKVGNEFKITDEILNVWKEAANVKRNEIQVVDKTSQRNVGSKISFNNTFLTWIFAFIIIVILTAFYFNLDSQIKETKKDLRQERIEHKTDVKELQKIVDSQKDTISTKEIEIQSLKLKDSLRLFKRW